ncbi:MAG TPA: cupin domain-containing protein [Gemmataceae bacterium]|nr:cupin domain-containing protein [Gemmataceae bacterium]
MSRNPVINSPPQGRTIAVVGDVYRFLATGDDTNGKYALWEALVPPGGGPPPHVHSREEEGFYVLEGEITFTINGERMVARAGMYANMPVGTPHSFKNESDKRARMLISVAPAGLEKMFFEVGGPLTEGATTALPPTKEIEKLLATAPSYGIEITVSGHLGDVAPVPQSSRPGKILDSRAEGDILKSVEYTTDLSDTDHAEGESCQRINSDASKMILLSCSEQWGCTCLSARKCWSSASSLRS